MIMKRSFIAFMLVLTLSAMASAQTGLEIGQIFNGRYAGDPTVTETMMSGNHQFLRRHDLNVFATFKGPSSKYASIIEPMVLADGAKSVGRNIRYKEGKLHYAFFMLRPITEGGEKVNRFLYYLNNAPQKGSNMMVVYFEGPISQSEASSLIQSMAKNVK